MNRSPAASPPIASAPTPSAPTPSGPTSATFTSCPAAPATAATGGAGPAAETAPAPPGSGGGSVDAAAAAPRSEAGGGPPGLARPAAGVRCRATAAVAPGDAGAPTALPLALRGSAAPPVPTEGLLPALLAPAGLAGGVDAPLAPAFGLLTGDATPPAARALAFRTRPAGLPGGVLCPERSGLPPAPTPAPLTGATDTLRPPGVLLPEGVRAGDALGDPRGAAPAALWCAWPGRVVAGRAVSAAGVPVALRPAGGGVAAGVGSAAAAASLVGEAAATAARATTAAGMREGGDAAGAAPALPAGERSGGAVRCGAAAAAGLGAAAYALERLFSLCWAAAARLRGAGAAAAAASLSSCTCAGLKWCARQTTSGALSMAAEVSESR